MTVDPAVALVCLVCGVWMTRAYLRGEHHFVARLAATASLAIVANFGYGAHRGRSNAVAAVALAAFVLTMLAIGVAKGRFHAPPR